MPLTASFRWGSRWSLQIWIDLADGGSSPGKDYEWERQDKDKQIQYQVGYYKTVFVRGSHRAVLKLLWDGAPVRSEFGAATKRGKQDKRNCP